MYYIPIVFIILEDEWQDLLDQVIKYLFINP